jgi:cyclic pyranopterin phosphate synthase
MPEEEYQFTPPSSLMQSDEIEEISKVFVRLGVNKIRLTGGEPLVRKDARDIIRRLSALPVHLTLTTNGTRLHEFSGLLKECGIQSLNISLDTLQSDRFQLLTRRDHFQLVYDNIQQMLSLGFHVKVNMVVMRSVNDQEILSFVAWTRDQPVHVRFIEFMPFTGNKWSGDRVFTWQEILERISEKYAFVPLERLRHETVKKYKVPGHSGSFAVISTMSAPFCSDCNRMRLTADGKMKNCLFSQSETDLLSAFRKGENIEMLIHSNILAKAKELGGQFKADVNTVSAEAIENRSMIRIGG